MSGSGSEQGGRVSRRGKDIIRNLLIGMLAVLALVATAFALTPWPSVLIVRALFDRGAAKASRKLEAYVPASVMTDTVRYDQADADALLDIHRPRGIVARGPTVVWILGGGFVSGRRGDVTNYAKILAGQGFVVVNVDYTIAPEAEYPGPVRQVSKALGFLSRNNKRLGLASGRLVLAGDSAGAQIAAQTAALVTNAAYARSLGVHAEIGTDQLAGVLLYCGVYDISGLGTCGGPLGWFIDSAGWAYSGERHWRVEGSLRTMSLAPHITTAFPPAFITAGNADPLEPQSRALSAALRKAGVRVEILFFPEDYEPPLGHEYQFDLDLAAARTALRKSVAWLQSLSP
jgi:acetyl esterase